MKSQVIYVNKLPSVSDFPEETVLFYDSIFDKNSKVKEWTEQFSYKISLKSGEQLKTIKSFEKVLNKISKLKVSKSTKLTFVALGGGTIGDFIGFIASVYLRGRNLVLIPSTWLAAVDSAHGGKTALNFEKAKNQIGSFYPADKIYISYEILKNLPKARWIESLGEVIKISILADKKLFNKLLDCQSPSQLIELLPRIVSLKYHFVNLDPIEQNGNRRMLNLGHTMGHVVEAYFKAPHGIAVLQGIVFSARWSLYRGLMKPAEYEKLMGNLEKITGFKNSDMVLKKISTPIVKKLLKKDKKITSREKIDFVFIKKIGNCVRESVEIDDIILEYQRQVAESHV